MISLKQMLFIVCLLILSAAAWILVNNTPDSTQPTKADPRNTASPFSDGKELGDIVSKIDLLSDTINQLKQNQLALEEQIEYLMSDGSITNGDETQDKVLLSKEEKAERDQIAQNEFRAQRQGQKLNFDNRLTSSPAAPDGWDSDIADKISNLFLSNPKFAAAVNPQSQCTGSLCRVDIEFAKGGSPSQKESLEFELLERMSGATEQGTVYSQKLANGNTQKTYYFARKGFSLGGTEHVALESETD